MRDPTSLSQSKEDSMIKLKLNEYDLTIYMSLQEA